MSDFFFDDSKDYVYEDEFGPRRPAYRPAVSPGKVTLTSRIVGAAPSGAQGHQQAASSSISGTPVQRKATDRERIVPGSGMSDWDAAFRPDLCASSHAERGVAPIQRKQQGDPEEEIALPPPGGGTKLPEDVQAEMEASFGADFSAVRIHEGPQAAAVGALAYTQGTDIHFQPGRYDPNSQRGRGLLGHELTHVVQQFQGRVQSTAQAKGAAINDDSLLEREADEMGARVSDVSRSRPAKAKAPKEPNRLAGHSGSRIVQLSPEPEKALGDKGLSGNHKPQLDDYKGQGVGKIGRVSAPAKTYEIAKSTGVIIRAKPHGGLPEIGRFLYNTEVFVHALDNTGGFYFVIASDTGKAGWINKDYVVTDRPDPDSWLHHITEPNLTTILDNEYVVTGKWTLETGNDYTTLATAVVAANQGRIGVDVDWAKAEEYKKTNPKKRYLDPWMVDNFAIYHGSNVKAGCNVWMPSVKYVRMLQTSGAIGSRPSIVNGAVDIGNGIAGFCRGVEDGILCSLWETLSGLWELGGQIIKGIKGALDGSLLASLADIYDAVKNLSWADAKKLVSEAVSMIKKAFGDFEKSWNHSDTFKKWHYRGSVVGAVALEAVLAYATGGATLVAKILAKVGKYLPKLGRVLDKLIKALGKLDIRRKKSKGPKNRNGDSHHDSNGNDTNNDPPNDNDNPKEQDASSGEAQGKNEPSQQESNQEESPKVKTRANDKDTLTEKGRNEPVPLTGSELSRVYSWASKRKEYLAKWSNFDSGSWPEETAKLLWGKGDRSIANNMTPDDLAAVIKERRGVKIPKEGGGYFDHLQEATQAENAIKKQVLAIQTRLKKLAKAGKKNSEEYRLLEGKSADISSIWGRYRQLNGAK